MAKINDEKLLKETMNELLYQIRLAQKPLKHAKKLLILFRSAFCKSSLKKQEVAIASSIPKNKNAKRPK